MKSNEILHNNSDVFIVQDKCARMTFLYESVLVMTDI